MFPRDGRVYAASLMLGQISGNLVRLGRGAVNSGSRFIACAWDPPGFSPSTDNHFHALKVVILRNDAAEEMF